MASESDFQSEEDKETALDESEDEDVDFNPFMRGSPSEEASSSLSSEVEGLDAEVVNSHSEDRVRTCEGESDHVVCMIDKVSVDERIGVSCEDERENGRIQGMENGSTSGIDAAEDVSEAPIRLRDSDIQPTSEFDDEDAICKRTRARYSLTSFTLDELEVFLQETDDEDDFQNVDEEEEYRKFLAAVLKGGDGDDLGNIDGNVEDDDDEDNDADFEIEIEEALESDADDCIITSHNDEEPERSTRRPTTRQNRRQTPSSKKNGVRREERPLCPLVPIMYSAPDASIPCLGAQFVTNWSNAPNFPSSGFVTHQIGQLHTLIYEHVQLLIQVYSLCVLDPSRQNIAAQVKGLLSEMLHKRDLVLAWRNVPYPTSCFDAQEVNSISVQTQKCIPYLSVSSDRSDGQESRWMPPISGTVLSVLDVEPLKLVGKYLHDVSKAVREHQKSCVETTNFYVEKQSLFPHPICPSPEKNCNVSRGDDPTPNECAVSPNYKGPKKTLAATLVENTKKQPVALVPSKIAKLAKAFYPLFNSALFPYKPPPPPVANRVLFTDAEDVLLAMGIMEYNNDWKSIQQRFLICKSEHQIFVRAKNRSSSKAPDNPIKAVRKLKTSPLTESELACIEKALGMFRNDWIALWRAVVPYRDPNLLPRQWRIAKGTQKSYKMASDRKEKHRVYELIRRRSKEAAVDDSHIESEVNHPELLGWNVNREDVMDNINKEAYVHEAFLADWRPNTSGLNAPYTFTSRLNSKCSPEDLASSRLCDSQEVPNNHGNKESQNKRQRVVEVVKSKSFQPYIRSGYLSKVLTSRASGNESHLEQQKASKPGDSNLVKLAPELPPVKLPPAVRVMSRASFRRSQLMGSTVKGASGSGPENPISVPTNLSTRVQGKNRVLNSNSSNVSSRNCETLNNRGIVEHRGADLAPQIHPLLFRSLEEGHEPSYTVNKASIIPTFSFFPALQHQINGNLLRNPDLPDPHTVSKSSSSKALASTSSSLDFHPFLQRTNGFNAKSFGAYSTSSPLTTNLELSRDRFVEELTYRGGTEPAQLASASNPTSPNTDANDLDLSIHLSFSCRKRKITNQEGPGIDPMGHQVKQLSQNASDDLSVPLETEDVGKSCSDDTNVQLDKLGGGSHFCNNNESVSGQPLLEIVMEQEELSDSDEEMEDVEFECEEITDSEGDEGSASEQIMNTKLKEQEKKVMATDINAQCSISGTCDISEGSRAQRKGRLGKGSTKGSWLSLNSRGSHQPEQSGGKSTENSVGVLPVISHPDRHSRKSTISRKKLLSKGKTELSGLDMLPSSSRKHRKLVIKPPLASRAVVKASCTEKDSSV